MKLHKYAICYMNLGEDLVEYYTTDSFFKALKVFFYIRNKHAFVSLNIRNSCIIINRGLA